MAKLQDTILVRQKKLMGQPHSVILLLLNFNFASFSCSIIPYPYPSVRGYQMVGVLPSARLYRGPRTILPPLPYPNPES